MAKKRKSNINSLYFGKIPKLDNKEKLYKKKCARCNEYHMMKHKEIYCEMCR